MATINVDDQTSIEDTYGTAVIEWGEANPMIVWNECMMFHEERLDEGETFGDDKELPALVQRELIPLLGDDFAVSVEWSDWDNNEDGYAYLQISVWLKLDLDPAMEQDEAFNLLWPAIATLHNVTDPGTFNSPYLFSSLAVRA